MFFTPVFLLVVFWKAQDWMKEQWYKPGWEPLSDRWRFCWEKTQMISNRRFLVGNVVVGDLSFMNKYSMFWEDVDVEFFSTKTFFLFGFIVEP